MSPTNWGPYVWVFLHTLAARVSDEAYPSIKVHIYNIVSRILSLLPCPECSQDSLHFFRGITLHHIPTKISFVHAIYLLHNRVNAKLRKPLFNSQYLSRYNNSNLGIAYVNFTQAFNTSSSRLMNDNMHRRLFVKQLYIWLTDNRKAFSEVQYAVPESIPGNTVDNSEQIHTPESIPGNTVENAEHEDILSLKYHTNTPEQEDMDIPNRYPDEIPDPIDEIPTEIAVEIKLVSEVHLSPIEPLSPSVENIMVPEKKRIRRKKDTVKK